MWAKPGSRATTSLIFGLYFIVHDPSGYKLMSIAWFFWLTRVKWRMTSISLTSGQSRCRSSAIAEWVVRDIRVRETHAAPSGTAEFKDKRFDRHE